MTGISTTAACALLLIAAFAQAQVPDDTPLWAYPMNPPDFEPSPDDGEPLRMKGSEASYTVTQLRDLFSAPTWRPEEHPVMPGIVREGRKPDIRACGVCHRESGTGGPENANIAGLPKAYMVRQMHDYREGRRSTAVPGRGPTRLMIAGAQAMTDAEIEAAAAYFSSLEPVARMRVEETDRVPKTFVAGWFLAALPGDATEPLGQRILELPEDLEQFEARDPHARFVAYVPPGSIARGAALVGDGRGRTVPCVACHGAELEGSDEIPPITGRSPTYLVRQLFEFRAGIRKGVMADQMRPAVASLSVDDMIDLAAYLATLPP
ncbi:MAG: c-type cytochrome [Pseudomonadales bacterium]|nr:c-type cytochrome [Pseudomonadales bacterium]